MSKIIKVDKNYFYLFPDNPKIDKTKLLITDESIYSITLPWDGIKVIKFIQHIIPVKLNKLVITDATANVGGDSLNFSNYFKTVNSVEINRLHCDALDNNIRVYKRNNINVICNNYLKVMNKLKQHMVYMDPPWGGTSYSTQTIVELKLGKYTLEQLINKIISANIFIIKAPYNYDYKSFFKKVGKGKKYKMLIRKKILILGFIRNKTS